MSPAEECAERAYDLADLIIRIRALSRTRPHQFLEDKQEVAKLARQLGDELKQLGRLPARAVLPFQTGTIASPKGHLIRVERRGRRAA